MNLLDIIFIGIGLAMDAFAVSICKGVTLKISFKRTCIIALFFGIFQGIMPLIGYLLGNSFQSIINSFSHWIAFFLLCLVGINMIKDSFKAKHNIANDNFSYRDLFFLAIATSIDALAIGITFSFFQVKILQASIIIAFITYIISLLGVWLGSRIGKVIKNKSEILGGVILILMGVKILLEHYI